MTKLLLITTPLGNLGEFTPRAVEALKSADKIYCENTPSALRLMSLSGISGKAVFTLHEANEASCAAGVVADLVRGVKVAYMSEAGVPCVSDPGFRLVRAVRREILARGSTEIGVEAIGVPAAFLNALVISGLPTDSFLFCAFPPPKSVGRQKFFAQHCRGEHTMIFYESCHRLLKSLEDLKQVVGPERIVSVSAELTKLHEMTQTARLGEIVLPKDPKGEWVICVGKEGYAL